MCRSPGALIFASLRETSSSTKRRARRRAFGRRLRAAPRVVRAVLMDRSGVDPFIMVLAPSVATGEVQLTGTLLALPTPRLVTRLALMKSMRRFREIVISKK